jgi:hypothetical protein
MCWTLPCNRNALVSWPRSSPNNSRLTPPKNLPFPSFPKRGQRFTEKIPPLKKGDRGGFERDFCRCHRLEFLNEFTTLVS